MAGARSLGDLPNGTYLTRRLPPGRYDIALKRFLSVKEAALHMTLEADRTYYLIVRRDPGIAAAPLRVFVADETDAKRAIATLRLTGNRLVVDGVQRVEAALEHLHVRTAPEILEVMTNQVAVVHRR